MALYSEKVMDHFMNPRNVGTIEDASGVGEVGNAKCGDIMKIYLKIENDIIACAFNKTDFPNFLRSENLGSAGQKDFFDTLRAVIFLKYNHFLIIG